MDPISTELLAALAGGAGGELGRQMWAGLRALVSRPVRDGRDDGVVVASGATELAALTEDPLDPGRAQALSVALAVRAALDAGFRTELEQWHDRARAVRTGDGEVSNSISGGIQYGHVVQGRDFTGLTLPPLPGTRDGV
ncbi:hypothetical protein [Streptomyces sp. NPDC002537]